METKKDFETSIIEDVNRLQELLKEREDIGRQDKLFQEKLKEHSLYKWDKINKVGVFYEDKN